MSALNNSGSLQNTLLFEPVSNLEHNVQFWRVNGMNIQEIKERVQSDLNRIFNAYPFDNARMKEYLFCKTLHDVLLHSAGHHEMTFHSEISRNMRLCCYCT